WLGVGHNSGTFFGKLRNPVPRQAKDGPLFVRPSPQFAVKLNRRLIPIEHRPLHPAALAFLGNLRQADKKSAAVAPAPYFRPNEKVLEIKSAPAHPGREIVKEERETDRLPCFVAEQHFSRRMRTEKNFPQLLLRRHDLVRSALVGRQ